MKIKRDKVQYRKLYTCSLGSDTIGIFGVALYL